MRTFASLYLLLLQSICGCDSLRLAMETASINKFSLLSYLNQQVLQQQLVEDNIQIAFIPSNYNDIVDEESNHLLLVNLAVRGEDEMVTPPAFIARLLRKMKA